MKKSVLLIPIAPGAGYFGYQQVQRSNSNVSNKIEVVDTIQAKPITPLRIVDFQDE